jgi:hypothetical protein
LLKGWEEADGRDAGHQIFVQDTRVTPRFLEPLFHPLLDGFEAAIDGFETRAHVSKLLAHVLEAGAHVLSQGRDGRGFEL